MRTKEEILNESLKLKSKTPDWDTTASLHERLTIEVLIDIRDILHQEAESRMRFEKECLGESE